MFIVEVSNLWIISNNNMAKNEKKIKTQKTEELEKKLAEIVTGWQRTQADFANYKKQSEEERVKLRSNANADLIYELLPVLDNFQRAAQHAPKELENDNWVLGIKHIEKQFENILADNGLERIKTINQHFNPHFHEALEHVKSDKPEGIIVEEILSGYKFNGEVLRPAKVKVSKGNLDGERTK